MTPKKVIIEDETANFFKVLILDLVENRLFFSFLRVNANPFFEKYCCF